MPIYSRCHHERMKNIHSYERKPAGALSWTGPGLYYYWPVHHELLTGKLPSSTKNAIIVPFSRPSSGSAKFSLFKLLHGFWRKSAKYLPRDCTHPCPRALAAFFLDDAWRTFTPTPLPFLATLLLPAISHSPQPTLRLQPLFGGVRPG